LLHKHPNLAATNQTAGAAKPAPLAPATNKPAPTAANLPPATNQPAATKPATNAAPAPAATPPAPKP